MQITLVFGSIATAYVTCRKNCLAIAPPTICRSNESLMAQKIFFGWPKFDTIKTRLPEGCEQFPCKRSHVNEVEGANRGYPSAEGPRLSP